MISLWSLLAAPARGQRRWQLVGVVALIALAPLLILLTLVPPQDERPPVALVNEDAPIVTTSPPVAAGKLLTENLIADVDAVDWILTDAATAQASLDSGDVLAVVTIPKTFSASVLTLGSATPERAELAVQTSTQHGYVGGVVAEALSYSLPAGVSAQLTQQFVSGTLSALTELGGGVEQAAQGAATITEGLAGAQAGAQGIGQGTGELAAGLTTMDEVLRALPAGARGLGEVTAAGALASEDLSLRLAERSLQSALAAAEQRETQIALTDLAAFGAELSGEQKAEFDALHARAQSASHDVTALVDPLAGALATDAETSAGVALGAAGISAVSGPVAEGLGDLADALSGAAAGAAALADANGQLSEGLTTLTGGSGQLAAALDQMQAAVPRYDATQQDQIAGVVARPIGVEATSQSGPTSALASSLAAFGPVALWIGAIAVHLAFLPFARSALTSAASAMRLARSAAVVLVGLGLVQAALVWVVLAVSGVAPDRALVAAALTAVTAVSFALVHQALVAFLPRAGLVVSLVLLGLQALAAGTLSAPGTTPSAAGPLAGLPLSLALQGTQALVGGSLHAVLASAVGLALWALVGAVGTVVAIRAARSRALSASVLARP